MCIRDRVITDTIIITSDKCDIIDNDNVERIQAWLSKSILMKFQINESEPLQLIILKRFKRILLICPNHVISQHVMDASHASEVEKFNFSYSLQDGHKNSTKQYLKVPESEKMFLISPPASPPPEFDFTKCEDAPQRHVQSHIPVSYTHLDVYKRQLWPLMIRYEQNKTNNSLSSWKWSSLLSNFYASPIMKCTLTRSTS